MYLAKTFTVKINGIYNYRVNNCGVIENLNSEATSAMLSYPDNYGEAEPIFTIPEPTVLDNFTYMTKQSDFCGTKSNLIGKARDGDKVIVKIVPSQSYTVSDERVKVGKVNLRDADVLIVDRTNNMRLSHFNIDFNKISSLTVEDEYPHRSVSGVKLYKGIKLPNLESMKIVGQGRGDEHLVAKGVHQLVLTDARITREYIELINRINPTIIIAGEIKGLETADVELETLLRSKLVSGPNLEHALTLVRSCSTTALPFIKCKHLMVSYTSTALLNHVNPDTLEELRIVNDSKLVGEYCCPITGDSVKKFTNLRSLSVGIFTGELKQDLELFSCEEAIGREGEIFPSSTGVMTGSVFATSYPTGYDRIVTGNSTLFTRVDSLSYETKIAGNLCVRELESNSSLPRDVELFQLGMVNPTLTIVRSRR